MEEGANAGRDGFAVFTGKDCHLLDFEAVRGALRCAVGHSQLDHTGLAVTGSVRLRLRPLDDSFGRRTDETDCRKNER